MNPEEMTQEQLARQNEIKSELKKLESEVNAIKKDSKRSEMQIQLGNEVYQKTMGSKLAESYNQRSQRGKAFEADLTQYDEGQRQTIQKAIDSGILNNTRKTHDFVDLVARVSAEKGVAFDFTNNERLKESGFAINGKDVNGFVTKDGITLNMNSSKSLNTVVGHEITHVLEGTEFYNELQQAVFDFARAKGELGTRWSSLKELYKDMDADINAELTSDLVGDYLFTDSDFLARLSTENRNVFEKVFDEIKYLCRVATAGSAEARKLEKVKHAFEEAYRAKTKNTVTEDGVKYALSQAGIQSIQNIGRKSVNNFNSQDVAATEQFARQYWGEMGTKSPFYRAWFGDWRENDATPIQIATNRGDARGVQKNADTGWDIQVSGKVFNETKVHTDSYNLAARPYLPYINDIVKNAVLLDSYGIDPNKPKSQNSLLMHSMYAVADIGNGPEVLKLYVEEMNNPNSADTTKRSYQLQNIEKYRPTGKSSQNTASSISPAAGNFVTVADLFAHVKQMDASFTPNPSSKVVNDDGTPKVVYHGSYKNFSVFDGNASKHSGAPAGSHFFTDDIDVGYSYTGYKETAKPGGHAYQGGVYPVYLNIKNPYFVDFGGRLWSEKVNGMDVNETAQYAKDNGYDGLIIHNVVDEGGMGDQNWNENVPRKPATDYVVFDSTQIKSATDNIGTFDGNNPDIRYSLSEGETTQYGDYNVYGEDIAIGPVRDDIGPVSEAISKNADYKSNLILEQTDDNRYLEVLNQLNAEIAMEEEIRKYNEFMAEEKRKYNKKMALEWLQRERELAQMKKAFEEAHVKSAAHDPAIAAMGNSKTWGDLLDDMVMEESRAAEMRKAQPTTATAEAMEFFGVDSKGDLKTVIKRSTMKTQGGFACFPDILNRNVKKVVPLEAYFDVAMHGSPTAVGFGSEETNMSARTLAEVIRHSKGYQGQKIRLLSCSTGRTTVDAYCFAEELANSLGVEVIAPNDLLYISQNGALRVGEFGDGKFVAYVPNQRRRIK